MSQPAPNPAAHDPTPALHLHGWRDPVVLAVALCALASGFGQFGVVAALGDVARTFGHVSHNRRSPIRPGCRAPTRGRPGHHPAVVARCACP